MRIAVVGRGLIGAAAARHLAQAGHEVTLIGPDEPSDRRTHAGPCASHWDEGRITRRLATHPFWADVSEASIARYPQIAREGGIAFFTRSGAMMAGPGDGAFLTAAKAVRAARGTPARHLDGGDLARGFPDFAFPPSFEALHEADTGHLSPRRLVAAQTEAARRHGARIVRSAVTAVRADTARAEVTVEGGVHACDRVLVAAGGHSRGLLPDLPPVEVRGRTVVLFRVTEAEAARLSTMPSVVFRWDDRAEPYLLPPIRYPDGGWWLKLGGDPDDLALGDDEIGPWFRSDGRPEVADYLRDMFAALLPRVAVEETRTLPCMTSYTADGLPVLARLGPCLAVATAGNGAGAKCSDELGRRGAALVAELEASGATTARAETMSGSS